MILFRREGSSTFRRAVEHALLDSASRKKWYLSVIDEMAQSLPIQTCLINGLEWCEVDFPADLRQASRVVRACEVGYGNNAFSPARYAWG